MHPGQSPHRDQSLGQQATGISLGAVQGGRGVPPAGSKQYKGGGELDEGPSLRAMQKLVRISGQPACGATCKAR